MSACWGPLAQERGRIAETIGPDDLRPDGDQATRVLRGYLQKTSLPQAPTAAPMVVVPEGPDGLIPMAQTDAALVKACAMGDVISSSAPDYGDPTPGLIGWMTDRFHGVPPANDCPAAPS